MQAAVSTARGPWRVTFVTNPDACNLACVMCAGHGPFAPPRPAGVAPRELSLALVERVVDEAAALGAREIVPSTMGEPLLWAGLDGLVDACRARGLRLNLTTNGTFPGRGARAWAERLVPVASDVKISWNAATAATHARVMRGSGFDRAVDDVRAFVAVRDAHAAAGGHRASVSFQFTALETNVDELAGVVRLAAALGVDRVKANHVVAHVDALRALSSRRDARAIARWNAAARAAHAAASEAPLASGERVRLQGVARIDSAPGEAPRGACPFLGREAWVDVEGRFRPCFRAEARHAALADFGDLATTSLAAIWNGEAYRALVASHAEREPCRVCPLRDVDVAAGVRRGDEPDALTAPRARTS